MRRRRMKAKRGVEVYKKRPKQPFKELTSPLVVKPSWAADRQFEAAPSRQISPEESKALGAFTAPRKERHVYTGTEIIGLGTLHKSNVVPVSSKEAAIDIGNMRRNK